MNEKRERARLSCKAAKKFEESGDYEAARHAMGELWRRLGERPVLDDLDQATAAEVLLRAGALSGWIGSAKQFEGAQEIAKNLIGESIAIFESLQRTEKVAEAQTDLAMCYWRQGAFDEARVLLREAMSRLGNKDSDIKAMALIRSAMVERSAKRFNDALRIYLDAVPLFEKSKNHALKGRLHMGFALMLRRLSESEHRRDYTDRALVEYAAASFHFEQAGHERYLARVENNLGLLLSTTGKLAEAHAHVDRARRIFVKLKDKGSIAQVDETRARVFLAEGRNAEAEKTARAAVRTFEQGDERALLAEAMTTHGIALARLKEFESSHRVFERAIEAAETAGDSEGAGMAALAMLEELGEWLLPNEALDIYERGDQLLANSPNPKTLARLRGCALRLLKAKRAAREEQFDTPYFVYAAKETAALLRQANYLANVKGGVASVLISGETGTGKEVLARMIHEWSGRAGEFVAINCAALADTILESQLFGHHKGSFAEALDDYPGAARQAVGGTLFLDEIGELSLANQGKILRLVEHGEIHPLGAPVPERLDVQITVATSINLEELVAKGVFRRDLLYRLNAFHLEIPPLRERPDDIAPLAEYFLAEAIYRQGKQVRFAPDAVLALRKLPLRGNARELRALIERTMLAAADKSIITKEAVETIAQRRTSHGNLIDQWANCALDEEVRLYEGGLIKAALEQTGGSVTRAARLLGVTHQGLAFILEGRQHELLSARKPIKRRRRSIIRKW
ncbi:MAG: sigma 54-interacting transcriptional regulator [Pyrinomonadaceae bacterium]